MGGRHSHPRHKSPPSKQQQHQEHQLQFIHQQRQLTPPLHRRLSEVDSARLACLETIAKGSSTGAVNPHGQENKILTRPQRPKTLQPLSFNKSKVFSQHRHGPSSKSRCFPSLNKNACYNSHASQTSSWLPPLENWSPGGSGLPYGWETAVDREGRTYFIKYILKVSCSVEYDLSANTSNINEGTMWVQVARNSSLKPYTVTSSSLGNVALHIMSEKMRADKDIECLWTVGPEYDDQCQKDKENSYVLNLVKQHQMQNNVNTSSC